MLLAVDIGNTMTTLAVLKGKKCAEKFSFETALSKKLIDVKLKIILRRIGLRYKNINKILVCSVVPGAQKVIEVALRKNFKAKPFIIGQDIKVPIVNHYKNPEQVGQDRLVCAYAVKKLYKTPAIIVDLGTAITFDVVSKRGEYIGGIIVPGMRLSLESLFKKTALLPFIDVERPQVLIGKDTKTSMLSGIFYGYGVLLDGLIAMIQKQVKGNPVVIVTGGHTKLMRKFSKKIKIIEEDLIFKGLWLISQK